MWHGCPRDSHQPNDIEIKLLKVPTLLNATLLLNQNFYGLSNLKENQKDIQMCTS